MSRKNRALLLLTIALAPLAAGCSSSHSDHGSDSLNPPAPGFDIARSDREAIEIADSVMVALGGRDAWDNTRIITWDFFGRRRHFWDKKTGALRIDTTNDYGTPYVVLMNLHTMEGRAFSDGIEIRSQAALAERLERARSWWINDAYWLLMPYKLKDTGVTLAYGGEANTPDGQPAYLLHLAFEGVGDTPDNRYDVYVGAESNLVEYWSFYVSRDDAEARMSNPWDDWRWCGEIKLSGGRGEREITDIAVFKHVPSAVFGDPDFDVTELLSD